MKRIPIEVYQDAATKLIYDPTAPSGLRWNDGREAGCQDGKGYWLVRVGKRPGRLLKAHRLIWFIHHGTLPDLLDHRDVNPANNLISNLREATESENRTNSGKHRDNTSGAKGVYWCKRTQSWLVQCSKNKKLHYAGRFKDKEAANEAARNLRETLHSGFVNHD